jgi:hypothetical protein
MSKANAPIYQIKITLKGSKPPIWRRLLVSSETRLSQFHHVIQAAMGWHDSHLHMFVANDKRYSIPYDADHLAELDARDSRRVKLADVVAQDEMFIYEYDFGDGWEHVIVVEEVLPPDPKQKLPVCLTGKRACPPEDVGGIWGYEDFLEAIRDPKHEEHEEYLEWIGGEFDPEAFDLDAVNKRLRNLR